MCAVHRDAVGAAAAPEAWAEGRSLVHAALRKDRDAVAALVERMTILPNIVAALNARFGSPLGPDELVDVSQDAAAVVWKKLASFQGEAKLETWFYGIARLEFANAARRKVRDHASVGLEGDEVVPALPSEDLDLELVHQALLRLPPNDAAVVRLYYFEGLTLDQVALRLGAPASSARRCFYRALDYLRLQLAASERKAAR